MKRYLIAFLIALGISGYILNYTSIPSEVILKHMKYDKSANYQDLEIYFTFFMFICFYLISVLGLSPIENNKKPEDQDSQNKLQ